MLDSQFLSVVSGESLQGNCTEYMTDMWSLRQCKISVRILHKR